MNEAAVWDRFAGRYDGIARVFGRSYPRVRKRLEQDLPEHARVLEVAAGTGQFTFDLAQHCRRLVATDVSPRMVEALARKLDEAGLSTVTAEVMSAYAIEAEDGGFDAVFCANALHVMDAPRRARAEFYRVLRPGGVLIAPTFLHGTDPLRRGLSRVMSLVSPFVSNARLDLDTLSSLVTEAGFELVYAERMPGLFPLGHVVAHR